MQLVNHRAQAGLCVPLLRVEPALRFERHDMGHLESKAQDRGALPLRPTVAQGQVLKALRSSILINHQMHRQQPSTIEERCKGENLVPLSLEIHLGTGHQHKRNDTGFRVAFD